MSSRRDRDPIWGLLAALAVICAEAVLIYTTPTQRRLWAMRTARAAARAAGRAAERIGRPQMDAELAGRRQDYTVAAAFWRARDAAWGLYERMRQA